MHQKPQPNGNNNYAEPHPIILRLHSFAGERDRRSRTLCGIARDVAQTTVDGMGQYATDRLTQLLRQVDNS